MNKVILMGRLVRAPEVRYMQNENLTATLEKFNNLLEESEKKLAGKE